MELLHKHVGTHRTCGIDECTFSAHPKLVEKHISLQHCTGLYNRMKNLSTPEDIQKWIVERKKKYPTKLIVERKKAEQMEKIKRGEIIEKQMKPARDSRKKPGREKKKRNIRKRKTKERVVKPEPTVQLYRGLLPFAGTANLPQIVTENGDQQQLELVEKIDETELADFTCNISDEEDEPIPVRCVKVPSQLPETPLVLPEVRPAVENQSALGSLMANYGSDSEDDEPPDEVPIKRIKMDIPVETESPKAPKEPFAELAHDQRKIEVQEKTEVPQKVTSDRRKNSKTPRDWKKPQTEEISSYPRTIDGNHYSQKRLMLLQRLLSRSIQHERNLICQCIKYIADNNFFSDDA